MALKAWGKEYQTTIVCANPCEGRMRCGRFYNPDLSEDKSFQCTTHFLLEMEQALNNMEFLRSFALILRHGTGPPKWDA